MLFQIKIINNKNCIFILSGVVYEHFTVFSMNLKFAIQNLKLLEK